MKYSHSSIGRFLDCPRYYKYVDVDCLEDPGGEAVEIGKTVHKAMEWWPNNCMDRTQADTLPGDASAIANGMLDAVQSQPWTVLNSEVRFEIETGKGLVVGVLDGLVWANGKLFILERKTTSFDPDTLITLKTIDRQTGLYYYGAMSMGHRPSGIALDIITRPKLRRKQGESAEEFRARICAATTHRWEFLSKTQAELEKTEQDVEDAIDLIQLGKFPRSTGSCYKYGRICPFFSRCI